MKSIKKQIKELKKQLTVERERADRNYEVAKFFENQNYLLSNVLQLYDGKLSVDQFRKELNMIPLEEVIDGR